MFKSIKAKLVFYFLLFAIIPLSVFALFVLISSTKNLEPAAINNFKSELNKKVRLINNRVAASVSDLIFLNKSMEVINLTEAIYLEDLDEIE